jgi:signal transduction histidine kinase
VVEREVFRNEVHSMFLRPFLDDAVERLGSANLGLILNRLGVAESRLRDQTAWVSLRFCEAFFQQIVDQSDPALFERCGRLAVTAKYSGILRPLFRTFGNPSFAYKQIAQATGLFNKVGEMSLTTRAPRSVVLEYRPLPGAPRETSPYICLARAAQIGALPMMFDFPPASTLHPECLHRNGVLCRYELTWKEYGNNRASLLGFGIGLAVGGAVAALLGFHGIGVAIGALAGGALIGSLGHGLQMQRLIAGQASDLGDARDALTRSAQFHEERFAQMTEAKAEVERQVTERTAELSETNLKLARTLDELKLLQEAERNFFANISHDLRTPLTLILAPLDELLNGVEISPASSRLLETVQRNAQQLRRLIDQLLDLEKVQAGRVQLQLTTSDIGALAVSVAMRFSAECAKRGVTLDVSSPGTFALSVDARWIDSAVMNLVSNATRFARSRISLRLQERADQIVIEVEDDGPGIPEAELAHIFDRFVQVGTAQEQRGGSGLGLAIAKEAARLHGGVLTVGSEVGVRTTFTLTLPRSEVDAGAVASAPNFETAVLPALAPERERRVWDGPSRDSPLVAVIEDDDELRVFMAESLSVAYRVEVACDGEEGLALIAARHPDAVVCDVAMPKLDGYELCRRVRRTPEARFTPIVLVTARRHVDRVLDGFEAGASDYLTKPFHSRELLARLESHLLVRRLLKESAHKERLVTLGMLAASVAHQVRNPLSAMTNTLVALQRKVLPSQVPSAPGMFELIGECATRIDRFTKDLLDLSRIDHSEAEDFKPANGIESVIRMMSATQVGTVKIDADLDHDIHVKGRLGDMNHVFMNLIDNALHAVGRQGRIDVRARMDSEDFVFEVGDSGPGIPCDKRDWIFEPFATTRSTDGTGLGLFIVKKIVLDHGGHIAVGESPLGGALFRVRIPGVSAPSGGTPPGSVTFVGAN